MSHHFDSPAAREDSRINISDNYLFAGSTPETLTAIVAVSPLAGLPSPYHGRTQWQTFRPDTGYELRFDTDGDLRPDVVFRLLFRGEEAPQRWTLTMLDGPDAVSPVAAGREVGRGQVESTVELPSGGRIWTGQAGDAFWLDAVAASGLIKTVTDGGPFTPDTFSTGCPTTAATNTLAIVAELPLDLFGPGTMNFWSTVSANDHGSWTQVARCGKPNFAATFIDNPERSTLHNRTTPDADVELFTLDVTTVVQRVVAAAGTAADPAGYASVAARSFLPDVLPYDPTLGTSYGFAGVNGRGLRDDFGAVVYSTVFNYPLRTALAPLLDLRETWPYLPVPRPLPSGSGVAVPARQQS